MNKIKATQKLRVIFHDAEGLTLNLRVKDIQKVLSGKHREAVLMAVENFEIATLPCTGISARLNGVAVQVDML